MQASQEPHPAQQPEEASDGPQEQIGPYKATYHASGVSSTVYRAKDPETGELIAVKVTLPSMMSAPHNSRREARILRAAACPHVLDVATMSLPSGHFLLTFPFVRHNFADLLRRRQLRSDQIRTHLAALFQALGHIHGLGIIHRDVKPSNLLIASPDGPVYLTDFGIAWQQDDPDSELAHEKITDVGTTCYRPPELLFGHSGYTEKLDLWAAGCVMAEAVTQGESLFDAGDVGSELALIKSIFSTLGTPIDSIWPEAQGFPDWGKMQFVEYPAKPWEEVLPTAEPRARDLVASLVQYESSTRLSAPQALQHPYFAQSQD